MKIGLAIGGFMGVGKTIVGRRVSEALFLPFLDLDEELVLAHGPVSKQFGAVGEAGFRLREREILQSQCDGIARVLSTGGGTWVAPENQQMLNQHFRTVVLTASFDVLKKRIDDLGGRPLWDTDVERLYLDRIPCYSHADHHIDTDKLCVEDVVEQVLKWWQKGL